MIKENNEEVKIEIGQVIDISFESMMGSTGYGWELSELSGPIRLIGISVIPSSATAIAPVTQVFHIKGIGKGDAKASFVLTAPWKIEDPIQSVTYQITVTEAAVADDDDLKIKGFVASPKATLSDKVPTVILYAVYPPSLKYGIPCDDAYERLYYGVLPKAYYGVLPQATADPRLYYGVCCAPSANDLSSSVNTLYNIRCAQTADCCSDVRMYYGVRCQQSAANIADPRVYYGVCCASDTDQCGTPPQIYKYGILPRPLYNVNFPIEKYNIPPVMRYNFPDKC